MEHPHWSIYIDLSIKHKFDIFTIDVYIIDIYIYIYVSRLSTVNAAQKDRGPFKNEFSYIYMLQYIFFLNSNVI